MVMAWFPLHFFWSQKVSGAPAMSYFFLAIRWSWFTLYLATRDERKKPAFKTFCCQLYHQCLERIFEPLKPFMTTPKVVKCPDAHFRQAIFGLGPYIADYPEQVYLSSTVQNWCATYIFILAILLTLSHWCNSCDAPARDLDCRQGHPRSHEKTDFLISEFSPGILWNEFGIRSDVVVCCIAVLWVYISLIINSLSLSHTISLVPTSMSYSHLISSTSL